MPVTIITGAASGIGAATRQQLEQLGHTVIGVDLRNSDICADLSTVEGRAQAIQAIRAAAGGAIDHIVCSAGLGPQVNPPSLVALVNYFGAVELLDGLFDLLKAGQNPSAVVISSNSATIADWSTHPLRAAMLRGDADDARRIADEGDGFTAYSCSKQAVACAVRQRALDWGQAGVRLNAVAPGAVETPLLHAGLSDPVYGPAIRDFNAPLGRRARADEIARSIAFLLGEQASFIHGSVLFIDGGMDAQLRPHQF